VVIFLKISQNFPLTMLLGLFFFFVFLQKWRKLVTNFFFVFLITGTTNYQVVVVTWEQDLGQPDRTVGGRTDGRTSTTKNSRSLPPHTQNATPFVHTFLLCSFFASRPSLPPSLALVVSSSSLRRIEEEEEEEEEQEKVSSLSLHNL
jgi:hypothetical protein